MKTRAARSAAGGAAMSSMDARRQSGMYIMGSGVSGLRKHEYLPVRSAE